VYVDTHVPFTAVNVTVYDPGFSNVCVGLGTLLLPVPPKFHVYPVAPPLKFVNVTANGALPVFGSAVNCADTVNSVMLIV
jgi:hypothetical protein